MSDSSTETGSRAESHNGPGEGTVYVIPENALVQRSESEFDLIELWNMLWQGRWLIVLATVLFAGMSVVYALLATEWYRAETLLAPVEEKSSPALGGQLGGLAALAGVSVGGHESAEALAVLQSREFLRSFIEAHNLMPILFKDQWDAELNQWAVRQGEDPPDIREGLKYLREDLLRVQESKDNRLVTVTIDWTDPVLAADWLTILIRRLNDQLREQALREAASNVGYLQGELAQTNIVTLQQSIGRLLETELQKLMLARGSEEFAFRVVDPPHEPKDRIYPQRALIAVLGMITGGIFGVLLVFLRRGFRSGFGSRV